MQGGDRTAEVAACCYRLDVSNVSISIYGVILTPTPRTDRCAMLLLECKKYLKKWNIFADNYAAFERAYYMEVMSVYKGWYGRNIFGENYENTDTWDT